MVLEGMAGRLTAFAERSWRRSRVRNRFGEEIQKH